MRRLLALVLLLVCVGVAKADVSDPQIVDGWKGSDTYKMCESLTGTKSDAYSDGVFDCDDWVRHFNKWVQKKTKVKESYTLAVMYNLGKEEKGHALSMLVTRNNYYIVDPQYAIGVKLDNLIDIWKVCVCFIDVVEYGSKEMPKAERENLIESLTYMFVESRQ